MLITSDQVDELLTTLADLSGLDEELVQRCALLMRTERYDEAVGRAFVVLEERMRALMGTGGGAGRHLVNTLFSSKDTQFTDRLRRPEEEVAGLRDIFSGSFAAFRNRAAHTVAGYTRDEARAIIHLVNLQLMVVDQMEKAPPLPKEAPQQQVPKEVAEILEPSVTQRLELFLDRLKEIGIFRTEGKQYLPYKARVRYHAAHWDKPRPHHVAIFYLLKWENPALGFNSGGLQSIPGLEVEDLEAQLERSGCTRVAAKSYRIRLNLTERNDQATFDRLFDILADLIGRHQVG